MFLNRAKVHTYRIIVLIYKLSLKVRVSKVCRQLALFARAQA